MLLISGAGANNCPSYGGKLQMTVGKFATFINSGTLTNGNTIRIEGTFDNSGLLINNGTITVNCGTFTMEK